MVLYRVDPETLEWVIAEEQEIIDVESTEDENEIDKKKNDNSKKKKKKQGKQDLSESKSKINDVIVQYHVGRMEKAKTGRGKCRGCGEIIEKSEIRVASPFKYKGGIISSWSHVRCFAKRFKSDILSESFNRNFIYFDESVEENEGNETFEKLIEYAKQMQKEADDMATSQADGDEDNLENENEKIYLKQIEFAKTQRVKPPSELRLALLPFQEEGLGWMIYKENKGESEGGILADQMGMGKTIQMISLILAGKYSPLHKKVHGPTLIVAPSSAMLQWKDEIERSCSPGSLSVLVYHSGSRSKLTPADIMQHDVVLTSYPILEYDYRTAINIQKVQCPYCKRMFLPRKLKIHNKYFCGPKAMRTVKQQLTERGEKDARNDMIIKKAMGTLKITKNDEEQKEEETKKGKKKSSFPTPSAIYTELMQEANRVPTQMYISKEKARALDEKALKKSTKDDENDDEEKKNKEEDDDDDLEEEVKKPEPKIVKKRQSAKKKMIIESTVSSSSSSESEEESVKGKKKRASGTSKKKTSEAKPKPRSQPSRLSKSKSTATKRSKHFTPSSDEDGSESEYEESTVSETESDEDDDDDMDMVEDDSSVEIIKPPKKTARSQNKKSTSSSKDNFIVDDDDEIEIDDEEEEEDHNEHGVTSKAKFVPQTWGKGEEPVEMISNERSRSSEKSKKKQKGKSSTSTSKKGKKIVDSEEDEDDSEESEDLKKPNSKKRKTTRKSSSASAKKGKKKIDSSSSSSSESEESEEEKIQLRNRKSNNAKGPKWYAKPGDVVDDEGNDLGMSLLHCIAWARIVLDEAHKIKDRVNSTAKSVFGLRGTPLKQITNTGTESWIRDKCHRWCLSGTPLQNRTGELYSLIRFLRVDPYAFFKCRGPTLTAAEKKKREQKKKEESSEAGKASSSSSSLATAIEMDCDSCSCTMLNWAFGWEAKLCVHCGHTPMRHFSVFNLFVSNPIRRYGYFGEGKKAMKLLKNEILGQHMLRRTKAERAADINLPPLEIQIREIEMTEEERDFYEAIYKRTKSRFDTFIEKGTVLNNFAHIFELLSRLRQATDHPYLVIHGNASNNTFGGNGGSSENGNRMAPIAPTRSAGVSDVCGICHLDIDGISNCAVAHCRHTFHRDCVETAISAWEAKHSSSADGDDDDNEEEDDDDIEDNDGGGKKKSKGKKAKRGRKKGKDDEKLSCPVCFQPLTITLDIRGIDEDSRGSDSIENTTQSQSSSSLTQIESALPNSQSEGNTCIVCMDAPRNALFLPCGHMLLCQSCSHSLNNRNCPVCRAKIVKIVKGESASSVPPLTPSLSLTSSPTIESQGSTMTNETVTTKRSNTSSSATTSKVLIGRKSILQRINLEEFSSSSKLDVVVEEVKKLESLPVSENGLPHKAIVFSQYTSMLHIIQWKLKRSGINTVMLFGSLNVQERRTVLNAFKTNPEVRVILMSLKSGGEGLNLQEASLVITCEPWWNGAVEMQAIQRAHRIGQTRKVTAIRCVVKNSVEERMMELQEKKRLIFEGTVEKNEQSLQQLTVEDLQFLFSR